MKILFKNTKLKRQFNETLDRTYGPIRARKIRARLAAFRVAYSLAAFWPPKSGPERCHELTGDRHGQLSVDLDHPYRLIFEPANVPIPRREDGGLIWEQVTDIMILGVEDTHE